MEQRIYDMVIIGGGPGGYTAALYAARAGLSALVVERMSAGGQMALTHEIDNYPGFDEGIDGFELGMKMQRGAERFGAETLLAEVRSVALHENPKRIVTASGDIYGRTVVIATGANPRQLGLSGEQEMTGRGVHYCAACDGMFYRGKTVVVVGGGNSAAADALLLSRVAEKVILVHRRDALRAEKAARDGLKKASNVEYRWNSVAEELIVDGRISGLKIRNVVTGEVSVLDCHGIFVSIGRKSASDLFRGQVELDDSGYILADESTKTSIPGVYAVGDVRTKAVRQIVTAVADGSVAVHMAEAWLAENQ